MMISFSCYILFKISLCLNSLEKHNYFLYIYLNNGASITLKWSVRCLNSSHHTTTRSKELMSSRKSSPKFNYDANKILFHFISSGEFKFNATCYNLGHQQYSIIFKGAVCRILDELGDLLV